MTKFIKPSSLFNILENHYIYNDFKKKIDILKENIEFSTLFDNYLTLCDSDFDSNEKMIDLFLKSVGEFKKPLKELSLKHSIEESKEQLINVNVVYKTNYSLDSSNTYIHQKACIHSSLILDIELVDLRQIYPIFFISLELTFSQAHNLKDYKLKFNVHSRDKKTILKEHEIYIPSKTREYNKKDQRIKLDQLPIIGYTNNKKVVYFNDYKNYRGYEEIIKDLNLKHPELNGLDKKELTSLFLTGGFSPDSMDLLRLTNDTLFSKDNYIIKDNKTIFDMIKKDNFSFKKSKKLKN